MCCLPQTQKTATCGDTYENTSALCSECVETAHQEFKQCSSCVLHAKRSPGIGFVFLSLPTLGWAVVCAIAVLVLRSWERFRLQRPCTRRDLAQAVRKLAHFSLVCLH